MKNHFFLFAIMASKILAASDAETRVSQLESNLACISTLAYNNHLILNSNDAYPIVNDPHHLKLEIGAVYQTIQVESSAYIDTFSCQGTDERDTIPPTHVQILTPSLKLTWGLNLAASYVPFLNEYDIKLANAYFENHSNLKKAVNGRNSFISGAGLFADWLVTSIFINLKTGYDLLGIEIGRATFISKKLLFRPFIGIMSSWLWLGEYSRAEPVDPENDPSTSISRKSNWFGLGPQGGFSTSLMLNKNISLFLDSKSALFYGSCKTSGLTAAEGDASYFVKTTAKKVIPYFNFILGASYECMKREEKDHFKLRAGYQLQYFLSANQMIYRFLQGNVNDIYTQGLILDLAWSF